MAERQVALVPTMVQLENFESYARAGEERFPAYAKHIRALYGSRLERFAAAREAGVPIYAGTDAGGYLPHGLVGREIAALAQFSSADYALGAGSWRARRWLEHPDTLEEGAPADLVVFDADPRADLGALLSPRHVILRGGVVQ
jgi:imidazolonepropionase-like amidohydrolase